MKIEKLKKLIVLSSLPPNKGVVQHISPYVDMELSCRIVERTHVHYIHDNIWATSWLMSNLYKTDTFGSTIPQAVRHILYLPI